MALNAKHTQFVNEYLQCFNATEAYQRVYKSVTRQTAAVNGHGLLRNANISEAITQRLQESAMSADEVLMRLAAHARGDIDDFLNDDGHFDLRKARRAKRTGLIRRFKKRTETKNLPDDVTQVTEYVEFELHDAQSALEKLARAHKLLIDKREQDNTGEIIFKVVYGNNDQPA